MKRFLIFIVLLSGCAAEHPCRVAKRSGCSRMHVAWEVKYRNNVIERLMVHQHCKLTKRGCFVDRGYVLRTDVRSARRIPLHVVEKDGVMYELD